MQMEDLKKQFDGERGGATHSLRTEGGGGRVSFLLLCPTAHRGGTSCQAGRPRLHK
eukprot:CAMPEP_0194331206 /NCGR_PEP_ID=MMETSP0171-20130528/54727_1 /TAXON_ID=218684 /ORGANISM="Corethron pennatum, Strain L29A3" /LENGTH=55 /DNA_ID=CAMNT_0039092583 /DNA_START=1 /DNA_END=165 /DNA_ORIENTATION=-